ncbi:hypothetical protein DFH94DRAFT_797569 [Russula ochroleuca]|uniref:DUF7918 domain-containing protein n=1 Tax=Russula ochroleuca TaxID=152965 RepID=A0A9P5N679_9AGAM|nr:hypothetical protein DFH94DRAFT_797569 [Russula ochroleuca]
MPLSLLSLNFAIICELETAFVVSEAGKKFSITFKNDLLDIRLAADLYIDGVRTHNGFLKAGRQRQVLGIRKTVSSVLPFKFQELELVDPDVENAPVDDVVVPEMGTIEIRTFRCRTVRTAQYHNRGHRLHQGRVSKRSNKAGWHHVSTADEIPTSRYKYATDLLTYLDPRDAPYASVKVFYRPRELLVDQGVIAGHDVGAGNGNPGGSEVNDRKRAREGGSPGPSKRAKEEMSALSQQIQALQAELNSIMAEQSRLRKALEITT